MSIREFLILGGVITCFLLSVISILYMEYLINLVLDGLLALKRSLGRLICKMRGHHNWEWSQYGGLGGSYCIRECTCCGVSDEDSFSPELGD